MEDKILRLIKLIGEEVLVFETFLQYLNRQQEALVNNDLEALQAVTLEQEALGEKTLQLESDRRALVAEISTGLDLESDDITLSELTKLVSGPQSNQLHSLQATLLDLHDQITTIKVRNDFLIRKSMEYINTTMSQLGLTAPNTGAAYTPESTKTSTTNASALVDRRA